MCYVFRFAVTIIGHLLYKRVEYCNCTYVFERLLTVLMNRNVQHIVVCGGMLCLYTAVVCGGMLCLYTTVVCGGMLCLYTTVVCGGMLCLYTTLCCYRSYALRFEQHSNHQAVWVF
jgi:hypothetical protein